VPTPPRIVVCSLEDWDEVWRRNQYLIDSLLRTDPELEVLFVEPPVDPLHAASRGRRPQWGRGLRLVEGYEGRLHTFQPTKVLPRRVGATADSLLARSVRSLVRGLGWDRPALWINDPRWLPLLESTGWRSLYDITDDWIQADRAVPEHDRLTAFDAQLLELCDEVVVCSPALLQSKGASRDITLIRNAVDVDRYRRARERPADLPDVPIALYAGTLHEDRLDVGLVLACAERLAVDGGRLVLVGPNALTAHNTARLRASSAVAVLGSRPKESIPAYLQHANALIVPHVVDDFTDSLDPIKLYEYLAVGRPIVSTPVAGFRDEAGTPGLVVAAGDDFVNGVTAALAGWLRTLERDDVPDWSDRGNEMSAVIRRLVAQGPVIV
jgi:teichuronic acid biosynthesis glycosyltransferase TuaH